VPDLTPVGYFRFEDPAGQVGIDTHLVTDGSLVYQIPMTYRDAPVPHPLIATAEHSVLGTRWIYDAETDPVWIDRVLDLVRTEGVSDPSIRRNVAPAEARGQQLGQLPGTARIDLRRVLTAGAAPAGPGIVGVVMGSWQDTSGCLATIIDM
jgi:hypothetical protein